MAGQQLPGTKRLDLKGRVDHHQALVTNNADKCMAVLVIVDDLMNLLVVHESPGSVNWVLWAHQNWLQCPYSEEDFLSWEDDQLPSPKKREEILDFVRGLQLRLNMTDAFDQIAPYLGNKALLTGLVGALLCAKPA